MHIYDFGVESSRYIPSLAATMGNETDNDATRAPAVKKPAGDVAVENQGPTLVAQNKLADPNKLFTESYGACTVGPTFGKTNTFSSADFAKNFWTPEFSGQLCTQSDAALTTVFDEKGDGDKLKGYKATEDTTVKNILATHKKGDHWTQNGTTYYVDSTGDLIEKDKKGVHFFGADGLKYDGNRKEGVLTHNGETVVRKGNEYFKKYPDGQEVQITEKQDIEALVKVEGMIFEQRRSVLEKMNAAGFEAAAGRGSRIVTGTDGVAVYKVDPDGNVIAKNSHDHGAFVRMKNGDMFRVCDGKVYRIDGEGHHQQEVQDADLPKIFKRGADGSITVDTVTIGAGDHYRDKEHNIQMGDQASRVTAATSQGEVAAHVDNGKSTIETPQRSYTYDPSGTGKYTVQNPNGAVDLSFDNASQTLITSGATFTPDGCQIGDISMGDDGSISDSILSIVPPDNDSVEDAEAISCAAEQVVGAQVQDSEADISNALADVGKCDANYGDLAELQADLTDLDIAGSATGLRGAGVARLNHERGAVLSAISALSTITQAAQNTVQLAGVENGDLTKEVVQEGADGNAAAAVLRRHGLGRPAAEEEQRTA